MTSQSVITRIEEMLIEIDKIEDLANRRALDWTEAYRSVDRFAPRLEALLPRDSHAFRIFWSRAQLSPVESGFKHNDRICYLEKWRAIILAILIELDPDGSSKRRVRPIPLVEPPNPVVGSAIVERALNEAAALIRLGGAPGCVDRVHTALHAYFRVVARDAGVTESSDSSLAVTFRKMIEAHQKLKPTGPRAQDIERVLRSSAAILDALNPVRNMATLAHPNEQLLDKAEATLVVNVARSLLAFVDTKLANDPK